MASIDSHLAACCPLQFHKAERNLLPPPVPPREITAFEILLERLLHDQARQNLTLKS